jgi:alpha-N-arabinofuranosidase
MPCRIASNLAAGSAICLVALQFSSAASPAYSRDTSGGDEARSIALVNPGFESPDPLQGWSLHVYGARPSIAVDATIRHEGRQSLRVKGDARSDTALGQEVKLRPGRWYRLTGWVRTENLDPKGATVCGTFQIQYPGGSGVVAAGKNHPGTTDWVVETLDFTPPPGDGTTRIAVFFVGFGKGTGTAWFDGQKLQEIDARVSTLTVTTQPVSPGTISPHQYGQFIEYLCGLTLSMFAEQVFDGSFEGVPPYRFEFRKETDRLEKPWYPDGAVHRGEFALDPAGAFNGKVAQRITQKPGDPCTLGISQQGKHVRSGEPLRCSLHLRSQGLESPVQVALWGQGKTYAASFRPTRVWQRYEAILEPAGTDLSATLTISFRGPGSLWIDQVSLMSTDNVFGWRRDVAEALRALKPGIIRFGGSTTEGFEWLSTIGDPAKRVPFSTVWGGLEPGNAGLEEFVQLCQWVGAEPLICVRFSGKTPDQAAQQVEYFNGAPTTPMGKSRAANGHAAPYGVKYWQIGNELGDENYQKGLAEFCKAMKAIDPGLKLMAAFPSPGLLREAGPWIDYICPHHYGCQNLAAMEADVARCRRLIAENAPGREIRLGITEWNTTAGDWGLRRAMLWTLDNALLCSRYHNFMHRHCDTIEIANRSNLADSFCSGIIQTSGTGLYKTPTYYAQQLYATHTGQRPLKIQIDADLASDPCLDSSATLSADGRTLSLFVVNCTTELQPRTLDLGALAPLDPSVQVWTLADTAASGERDAANDWRQPDRIRVVARNAALDGAKLVYRFPPLSLVVLKVKRNSLPGH